MSIRNLRKADIYSPFITVVILGNTGDTQTGITNYECSYVLESKVFHMVLFKQWKKGVSSSVFFDNDFKSTE